MNPIKGENLMIFVREGDLYGNASNQLIALALATSCSLELSIEPFDVTSKDSGSWASSVPGMKSFSMSTENLYCPDYDRLLALAIARTPLTLYWIPSHNTEALNQVTHTPTLSEGGNTYKFLMGTAWINNVSATASNNEAANYSVQFTGTGMLTQSNSLPSVGIGVSRDVLAMAQGGSAEVIVTGATGTLSATTSNAKVTCTIANGVATIAAAADCPAGAYIVTIADAYTSTTAYGRPGRPCICYPAPTDPGRRAPHRSFLPYHWNSDTP